jgi:hypothetical protein
VSHFTSGHNEKRRILELNTGAAEQFYLLPHEVYEEIYDADAHDLLPAEIYQHGDRQPEGREWAEDKVCELYPSVCKLLNCSEHHGTKRDWKFSCHSLPVDSSSETLNILAIFLLAASRSELIITEPITLGDW